MATLADNKAVHVEATARLSMISVEGIETFKYIVMAVVLVMTVVSALAPLWISNNGTARTRRLLTQKLPFVTAGVFMGSGLLHLLPDAVKIYSKVQAAEPEMFAEKWLRDFPMMYLLSAVGCMVVWAVDLVSLGDSGDIVAVSSNAMESTGGPVGVYRMLLPPVTLLGLRNRSISVDGSNWPESRPEPCPCPCSCESSRSSSDYVGSKKAHNATNHLDPAQVAIGINYPVKPTLVSADDGKPIQRVTSTAAGLPSPVMPFVLAILFSLHSLIAGFALGVNRTSSKAAVATTVAILSHKMIEAMSVGANFAREKLSIGQSQAIAMLLLYSVMTPLGIFLGMVLSGALQGTAVLMAEALALSVASGSFVYLSFHEMSEEQDAIRETASTEKVLLFAAGLFSMAVLATWT